MLCYAMLCHAMLCYAMLCYAALATLATLAMRAMLRYASCASYSMPHMLAMLATIFSLRESQWHNATQRHPRNASATDPNGTAMRTCREHGSKINANTAPRPPLKSKNSSHSRKRARRGLEVFLILLKLLQGILQVLWRTGLKSHRNLA